MEPTLPIAILAGGRSRRMGQDKALLNFEGRRLVEAAIDVAMQLGQLGSPPILIVSREQLTDARYRELAEGRRVRLAADDYDHQGPLGGLATALNLCPEEPGIVLLACDMPFLTAALIRHLLACHGLEGPKNGPAGVTMPVDRHGRRQPLVAIYDRATRPVVEAMIRAGELRLEALSTHVPTRLVPFEELRRLPGHDRFFTNLNQPDDLEAVDRLHPPPIVG